MKITIENALSNYSFYENFIPLNVQNMIEESPEQFTVLGARSKEEYAGIVIAKKNIDLSLMRIHYIAVSDWNKNTGLEEMFLYLLEDIASVEKIRQIHFEYNGDRNEYFYYMDGLLRKNNWTSFRPKSFNYLLSRNGIMQELRYNKHFNSNNHLVFFEWGLFPANERLEVLRGEGKWYPHNHSPFNDDEKIEKSSLGVKLDGKVIGWFIIQRVEKQTIIVKSIFLKEEFRSAQNCIQLLIIGFIQTLKLPGWQYLILNLDDQNKQLQLFVERVLRRAVLNKSVEFISKKKVL
ncbi:hypothetical protein [Ureibacillus acetophenoni]|uniref:N-acetyltransferase domain-containing protein n=1 Tax=Ureibacillus acetophenoni TaxID=614649 RepID=A0A285U345_9BACL|nr:hypothetical protein [Ureibacillus acetophenoni]SOC34916.1 hypothetical protein SAMN05877842_101161 [Ureibacillus acetophenoni]